VNIIKEIITNFKTNNIPKFDLFAEENPVESEYGDEDYTYNGIVNIKDTETEGLLTITSEILIVQYKDGPENEWVYLPYRDIVFFAINSENRYIMLTYVKYPQSNEEDSHNLKFYPQNENDCKSIYLP
jgi:hypothetical protein